MGNGAGMYDYLIVGAGLYGATFARVATDAGKKCLVIDRREHLAGNCHDARQNGILVNTYGGHIFHTNSKPVWEFVNRFSAFSSYVHKVKVNYYGRIYSFPINLQTFQQLWGLETVEEVQERLEREKIDRYRGGSFEDWVLSQVGFDVYNTFFKGYTEKQWNKSCQDLPQAIAKRIPIRMNHDDRYFSDKFQGMPTEGYTEMVRRMLEGIEVRLGEPYETKDLNWGFGFCVAAKKVVYTGPLDELFDYRYGKLEYRSLRFEHEALEGDHQGCATVNYTDPETPFTRIIEWKHFRPEEQHRDTIVTWEYPADNGEPYYPVNTIHNNEIYKLYRALVPDWMVVGGRLGSFQYYNMDQVIAQALKDVRAEL